MGTSDGHSQGFRGLGHGHAAEETQLDERSRLRVGPSKFVKSFVDRQDLFVGSRSSEVSRIERFAFRLPAALGGRATACLIDENPAHRLGGGGEKMPSAVPVLGVLDIHKPQIGLMYQGSRLKCLTGLLLPQSLRSELA